ncbi:Fic family protein [Deinococcus cellulosilyticus]|uniref:Fido domain-containing protein n=1 Tax=Deinococcus cellulosilyticus (strain DSM 18568 / NBRC 106333 / KACC 11606 / 5516J-15) TaxID=1223518 RepID=A0A511N4B5_DEIC1|nr:Fic family protein [Deinococcus cellulosilyticus]GEM47720.1 hypothetical protein DC3_33550 [Deinococcus cellulosilyticus NBRC 106333 = KACC 11606]
MQESIQKHCDNIQKLSDRLEQLGGVPDTVVHNNEWLYMLQEETRHSLSIEGYFATEQELKLILSGKKTGPEILNYFRIAQSMYDLGLQYHQEQDLRLDLATIRHIHSELFRELTQDRGQFRQGRITILGARVKPPEFDVEEHVRAFVQVTRHLLEQEPLLLALARSHALFESIHPFRDGNGRTGRIILNYLAVSKGLPPLIIKGTEQEARDTYYHALESADVGFHDGFPVPSKQSILQALDLGNWEPLVELFAQALTPQLHTLLALAVEAKEPLMPLSDLSGLLDVKVSTLRKWVERDQLVTLKRNGKHFSHPLLVMSTSAPKHAPDRLDE